MRILIAEDELVTQRLLQGTLQKWGHEVITSSTGTEALKVLCGENPPTVAILDWLIPEIDGPEICRMIRAINREPYIYIILLTGKTEQSDLIEGIKAGADEYLTKPFQHAELKVRLETGQRILDLQSQLIAAREQLREVAVHDGLTGLYNRGAIMEMVHKEVSLFNRGKGHFGLILTDIDFFKQVNDTRGHLAGDHVLKEFARLIGLSKRPYDSAGRYGGEEFLILLPGCNTEEALAIAERLRVQTQNHTVPFNGQAIQFTASMGALSTDQFANNADAFLIIQAADRALYRAKNQGRNRIEPINAEDLK